MDGFVWSAILLWNAITIVQDKLLRKQLGFDWGWWAIINSGVFTVGAAIATFVTLTIWFSSRLDSLVKSYVVILLSIFTLIFAAIAIAVQWFVFKRQYLPKPIVLAAFNVLVAIVAYVLLAVFYSNALWNRDLKPVVASVFVGAAVGVASGIAINRYCTYLNRKEEQQKDEDEDEELKTTT
ncbi:hypothetical protein H6G76_35650 [Nostoc sp. FACHB-152]|uniref:hypothetical protein n=1 Tax=unclassified Nostoc TaxID=2593658 RepID=UPI0016864D9B|nr:MULTISPECIES: hypothetical protein [unclassified Nostoc]MBD2452346.1 hypothetical protein [Nostoc sp. FACHB-152]MBD2473205.1 hypothetical protein [Nostoc sp. FACHB-145]